MGSMRGAMWGLVVVLAVGACGGGGGGSGTPTPPTPPTPTTITVTGTVYERQITGLLRPPEVGLFVLIEGHPEQVTDGAGRFVVEEVSTPYTVVLLEDAGAGAVVYAGLTRPDPVLAGPLPGSVTQQSTWVSGNVTGGVGWPTPSGYQTRVAYGNSSIGQMTGATASMVDGHYDVNLGWPESPTLTVTGAALQWETVGMGAAANFTGFGSALVEATHGVSLTAADIGLSPVSTELVTGTVAIPSGYGSHTAYLHAELDTGPQLVIWMGTHAAGPFSVPTPDLSNATLRLSLLSSAPTGERSDLYQVVQPGATGLSFQIPEAVYKIAPSDGTTNVTNETPFQVSVHTNRVYTASYFPAFPSDGPYLLLTTSENSWRIPDLSAHGVTFPAGATYQWAAEGVGPATVDDVCDDQPFASRASSHWTRSGNTEFTLAP